jgi:beta-galactosidase
MTVRAVLHPESTSYREVEWSVVMDGGIPCPTAKVEAKGLGATVTALSDGRFRIRCTSKNGTGRIRLISEQTMFRSSLKIWISPPGGLKNRYLRQVEH